MRGLEGLENCTLKICDAFGRRPGEFRGIPWAALGLSSPPLGLQWGFSRCSLGRLGPSFVCLSLERSVAKQLARRDVLLWAFSGRLLWGWLALFVTSPCALGVHWAVFLANASLKSKLPAGVFCPPPRSRRFPCFPSWRMVLSSSPPQLRLSAAKRT